MEFLAGLVVISDEMGIGRTQLEQRTEQVDMHTEIGEDSEWVRQMAREIDPAGD
jgi:hypothetical protein